MWNVFSKLYNINMLPVFCLRHIDHTLWQTFLHHKKSSVCQIGRFEVFMQLSIRHSSTRTDLPYSLISNKYVVRTQVSTQISVTYRWNQEQCSNNCACNVKTFQSKAECAWMLFRVANLKRLIHEPIVFNFLIFSKLLRTLFCW